MNHSAVSRKANCYWCGVETLASHKVGPSHARCSTIDHLRSKPECVSRKEYEDGKNKVNACYACNQRRSHEWVARMTAGLVHPTPWSLRMAEKELRRRERKRAKKAELEFLKHCDLRPAIRVIVPAELSAAFES